MNYAGATSGSTDTLPSVVQVRLKTLLATGTQAKLAYMRR